VCDEVNGRIGVENKYSLRDRICVCVG
jgi:hypothetical protein